MTVTNAIDLLDMPEAKRVEVIEAAITGTGKVDTGSVRKQVREHHLSDDNAPTTTEESINPIKPPKPGKARSVKEMKEFVQAETTADGKRGKFATGLMGFISGTVSDADFAELWDKCFGVRA